MYTLKPGHLQQQQQWSTSSFPLGLSYSASSERWEGEDPGNQVGQSLEKDLVKDKIG